jgi:GTP-binding protein
MDASGVSYQAVLTKSDKVKPSELARTLEVTRAQLGGHAAAFPQVLPTSSEVGAGFAELRGEIARLLASRLKGA